MDYSIIRTLVSPETNNFLKAGKPAVLSYDSLCMGVSRARTGQR